MPGLRTETSRSPARRASGVDKQTTEATACRRMVRRTGQKTPEYTVSPAGVRAAAKLRHRSQTSPTSTPHARLKQTPAAALR